MAASGEEVLIADLALPKNKLPPFYLEQVKTDYR